MSFFRVWITKTYNLAQLLGWSYILALIFELEFKSTSLSLNLY